MSQLHRPSLDEIPVLAATIAATLADNPLFVFLFPDDEHRESDLTTYHAWLLSSFLNSGHTSTIAVTERDEGVIAWSLGQPTHAHAMKVLRPTFHDPDVVKRSRLLAADDRLGFPADPYLFLPFVTVSQRHQGQGFGSTLTSALLDKADQLRLPVATTTPVPDAVVFLERFEFKVVKESPPAAFGPHRWTLLRPAPAASARHQRWPH
ncbi:MAG: hypothetical protein WCK41_06745 [Actinomycetes bacterium]